MESPLLMLVHSTAITAVIFGVLRYALGQSVNKALRYSMLGGALILVYMLVWGHNLPSFPSFN
jgi:asparagine N-glycosylation enzyme membrane subunit Stt3